MISFEEFKALTARGNIIPLYEELMADTETPVSVYMKIRGESPFSFLFESVEGGEKIGRYSFIGYNPFLVFEIKDSGFRMKPRHEDVLVFPRLVDPSAHPLEALKRIFAHCRAVPIPGLPRFTGGAVGYFGYESARLVENIPVAPIDELGLNDAQLMFFDTLLVFDSLRHHVMLVANTYIPENASEDQLRAEYRKAEVEINKLKSVMRKSVMPDLPPLTTNGKILGSATKESFMKQVEQAKQLIVEGDIFQVVLSHRLKTTIEGDPFTLYRMLRKINPSPYLYFLEMEELKIIGSSPELLVRVENGMVETRPIAGTRQRGSTPEEDARLEKELLADEKERAEHLMLIDLGRNDIGRISEFGSVEVTQFMVTERYSHVMHIVSNVRGKLRKGLSAVDALYSCFPAGTLSGAPKIRAMEIIAALEPTKRGVYGGAIGYLDFSGNLDSCIAIRTIVVKDDTAYFQAGAGIVFDSVPEREYTESLDKMAANLMALKSVQRRENTDSADQSR